MTSDEMVDECLYREQRCYVCEEIVPAREGSRWRVSARQHLFLHAECSRRVKSKFDKRARRTLDQHLPALRAMRPTNGVS